MIVTLASKWQIAFAGVKFVQPQIFYFKPCICHLKKPSEQLEDIHQHSPVLAAGDSSGGLEGAHIQPHDPPHMLNMNFRSHLNV